MVSTIYIAVMKSFERPKFIPCSPKIITLPDDAPAGLCFILKKSLRSLPIKNNHLHL
jgi:hypothetical protein